MEFIDNFSGLNVLIVGDVMLDRYCWGSVDRISPEAPVPVVRLAHNTNVPGGAANVASNVAGLGARPILVGIVGDDEDGSVLPTSLESFGVPGSHIIPIPGRRTTVKTRIVAHGQQVIRLDQETDSDISDVEEELVLASLAELMPTADIVVVSDYAKGLLTKRILRQLIAMARESGKSIVVDPKGRDYSKYDGASLLTPNRREAADAAGLDINTVDLVSLAGSKLLADRSVDALLVTQGEEGMTLFESNSEPFHLKALAREVYDVTGAGDTVIATFAVASAAGADRREAAKLANIAARIVVGQIGTTSITVEELKTALQERA